MREHFAHYIVPITDKIQSYQKIKSSVTVVLLFLKPQPAMFVHGFIFVFLQAPCCLLKDVLSDASLHDFEK